MSAIIVSALFAPLPALAAKAEKAAAKIKTTNQEMHYDVYAGGFHVVSSELKVDLAKGSRYLLRLGAYTHGMLGKLAPWKGVFETTGWYDSKKALPQPETLLSSG